MGDSEHDGEYQQELNRSELSCLPMDQLLLLILLLFPQIDQASGVLVFQLGPLLPPPPERPANGIPE
jgi:hypothetical protein